MSVKDNYKCQDCGRETYLLLGVLGHQKPKCEHCGGTLAPKVK